MFVAFIRLLTFFFSMQGVRGDSMSLMFVTFIRPLTFFFSMQGVRGDSMSPYSMSPYVRRLIARLIVPLFDQLLPYVV